MRDIDRHGLDYFWDPEEDHEPLTPQEYASAKRRIRRNWWGRGEKDPMKHGDTIIELLAATLMLERTRDRMEAVAKQLQEHLRDMGYLGDSLPVDAEPGPTYLAEVPLGIAEPFQPRLYDGDALFWLLRDRWTDNDGRITEDRLDSLHNVLTWDKGTFWDLNYY